MAATITSTSVVGNPVNFVVQERFLRRANQLMTYFMGTVSGQLIQHGSTFKVRWRRFAQISPSTTALSELTGNVSFPTRTAETPSETDITGTVLKYGKFILLGEELELREPTNLGLELADLLGEVAGRSLNQLMRNEMEDNATQIRAGGQTADNAIVDKVTRNGIRAVVRTLANNSARMFSPMTLGDLKFNTSPILPAYWLFCHEDIRPDIEDLAGFVSVQSYAGQIETAMGEFGSAGRVRCIATEEASVATGSGGAVGSTGLRSTASNIDLYETIIMGRDAVGAMGFGTQPVDSQYRADTPPAQVTFINQPTGSGGVADPLAELRTFGYKFWSEEKILNTAWIRRFTSGATNLQ